MKDETYAFIEDVKERKSQARSAANKKNGSKSKKCTLPSDYLSKKEREKMNGEVKTWDLNKFYTWKEFTEMPEDIQVAYISTISQKYKVGLRAISYYQFVRSPSCLYLYLHRKGVDKKVKLFEGSRALKDNIESYTMAVEKSRTADLIFGKDESIDAKTKRIMPETATDYPNTSGISFSNNPDCASSKPKASIDGLDFTLTLQKFDAEVFNKIAAIFDDEEVRVYMHIRKVNRSKKSADVV